MEKKYGKNQLQKCVSNVLSENWIEKNSRSCPKCNTAIEVSYYFILLFLNNINKKKNINYISCRLENRRLQQNDMLEVPSELLLVVFYKIIE